MLLFDLTTRHGARPSPFCWRAKLALKHKGLLHDEKACHYSDIRSIGDGSFRTVPVMQDGGVFVGGSLNIAEYLEKTYPDTPTLFPDDPHHRYAKFVEAWVDTSLQPQIFHTLAYDIFLLMPDAEQPYFRKTREARLGMTLEEARDLAPSKLPAAQASFLPLRRRLQEQPFLCGDAPAYADYIAYGALKWQRLCCDRELLSDAADPIHAWFSHIDGLATAHAPTGS